MWVQESVLWKLHRRMKHWYYWFPLGANDEIFTLDPPGESVARRCLSVDSRNWESNQPPSALSGVCLFTLMQKEMQLTCQSTNRVSIHRICNSQCILEESALSSFLLLELKCKIILNRIWWRLEFWTGFSVAEFGYSHKSCGSDHWTVLCDTDRFFILPTAVCLWSISDLVFNSFLSTDQ